jgi:hypothetical protein
MLLNSESIGNIYVLNFFVSLITTASRRKSQGIENVWICVFCHSRSLAVRFTWKNIRSIAFYPIYFISIKTIFSRKTF